MTDAQSQDSKSTTAAELRDVVCPFCALLCDDVSLPLRSDRPHADALACRKARQGFTLALARTTAEPLLDGRPASWAAALARTRQLLADARLPLFDGLLGDLLDSRAAWWLASHYGGVVDHCHGDMIARNLAVYQDSGWINTSLGEARNRADLLVLLGDGIEQALPRLAEKLFRPAARLHTARDCELLRLREQPLRVLDQCRILLAGRPLKHPDALALELRQRLAGSDYPVFLVGPVPHPLTAPAPDAYGELVLRSAADLVRDIHATGRAALLPLSSGLGDTTAQLSGGWHNGFGIRTSFAGGYPQQDLQRYSSRRLLAEGAADLHVWLSSLSPEVAPSVEPPQVVIGHPATEFGARPPAVYLPVAVPGVQRAGFLHRGDGLRMLPLGMLVGSELPGSDQLCRRLLSDQGEDSPC